MTDNAARVFYVLTFLAGLGCVFGLASRLAGRTGFETIIIIDLAVSAVISYATAEGLKRRRIWAKWAGYVQAALLLLVFPIGTIVGVVLFVWLTRASRAGVFASADSPTGSGV